MVQNELEAQPSHEVRALHNDVPLPIRTTEALEGYVAA